MTKNDLAQIIQHAADKHRGMEYAPISVRLLEQVAQALGAPEPPARHPDDYCVGCSAADPFKCNGKDAYDREACPCVCHGL